VYFKAEKENAHFPRLPDQMGSHDGDDQQQQGDQHQGEEHHENGDREPLVEHDQLDAQGGDGGDEKTTPDRSELNSPPPVMRLPGAAPVGPVNVAGMSAEQARKILIEELGEVAKSIIERAVGNSYSRSTTT